MVSSVSFWRDGVVEETHLILCFFFTCVQIAWRETHTEVEKEAGSEIWRELESACRAWRLGHGWGRRDQPGRVMSRGRIAAAPTSRHGGPVAVSLSVYLSVSVSHSVVVEWTSITVKSWAGVDIIKRLTRSQPRPRRRQRRVGFPLHFFCGSSVHHSSKQPERPKADPTTS